MVVLEAVLASGCGVGGSAEAVYRWAGTREVGFEASFSQLDRGTRAGFCIFCAKVPLFLLISQLDRGTRAGFCIFQPRRTLPEKPSCICVRLSRESSSILQVGQACGVTREVDLAFGPVRTGGSPPITPFEHWFSGASCKRGLPGIDARNSAHSRWHSRGRRAHPILTLEPVCLGFEPFLTSAGDRAFSREFGEFEKVACSDPFAGAVLSGTLLYSVGDGRSGI